MRLHTVALLFVALACPGAAHLASAQAITGTVTDNKEDTKDGSGGKPLRNIQVTLLDAVNAEPLALALTDFEGRYNTGLVPAGTYRVRFTDPFGSVTPGFYLPEFFGANGDDLFCAAAPVPVPRLATVTVDEAMVFSQPMLVVSSPGAVRGHVAAADTHAPIEGIQVIILDAASANVLWTGVTDSNGDYETAFTLLTGPVRIRFADPSRTFFPQYAGAAGRDVFCEAAVLDLSVSKGPDVDAFMERILTEHLTQHLIDVIDAFDLPAGVNTMLSTPITRMLDLLTDGNPANDTAVCGQMTAFTSRVQVLERRGQLSPLEAEALRQAADEVAGSLGCS